MEKYIPEIAACALWGLVGGMILYGALSKRFSGSRLTRFLMLIASLLIGCILAVYVIHALIA